MDLSRRNFLQGTVSGAAGTALAGGVLIGGAQADANAATQGDRGHRGGVVPVPRRAPVRHPDPGPVRQAGGHLRRVLRRHGGEQGGARRAVPDAHQQGAVPHRRRHAAQPGRRPAAVGQRRARPVRAGRRADRDLSAGSSAVRRPLRAGGPQAAQAQAARAFPNDSPDPAWLHGDLRPAVQRQPPPTRYTTRCGTSLSTPGAACSRGGRSRATTRRRGRRAPGGTCSASRTAPRTRPAPSRVA